MSTKRSQPFWSIGDTVPEPSLRVYNSLTRQKELFVPKNGRQVLWYSCGPTVYDAAHMGHARSYISFDILRRLLSGYFGYDVVYVMNITDIDDKIIKRARQQHLLKEYLAKDWPLETFLTDTKDALKLLTQKCEITTDDDVKQMLLKISDKVTKAAKELEDTVNSQDASKIQESQNVLLEAVKDPLSDWLDKQHGAEITDNSVFSELPKYWEAEFHKDMDALKVLRPHVLTRVSEYIDEIISYIEKIINRNLAYESKGSVYFDVGTFDAKENHHYAKLVPEAYGDTAELQSGEGILTEAGEKKSPTDFALWKSSKPGEPWWDSPWGKGRPGWHIECSVMASAICGNSLDIHTGGVDLKFPHHDNEIAQAEAYYDSDSWVRYFLHSGHLTISGCKMSKSLKNFVSIGDALKKHTARQLRLAFLLHSWRDTLDYSDNTMDMAVSYEKMLNEFFLTVKDVTRSIKGSTTNKTFGKWSNNEMKLNDVLSHTKETVHAALCDNFDTRTALNSIKECIGSCHLYLQNKYVDAVLLQTISSYLTKLMKIFGVIEESDDIGFPVSGTSGVGNVEDVVMPFLGALAHFRDDVRHQARELKASGILQTCDRLRDDVLPDLGVRLEDREGKPTAVKMVDKETLVREKEAKRQAEEEKARKKAALEAAKKEKEDQKKISPKEMFLKEGKYSAFDENGLPTHDNEGKELSKGLLKKLQKLQQTQEKKYMEYLSTRTANLEL